MCKTDKGFNTEVSGIVGLDLSLTGTGYARIDLHTGSILYKTFGTKASFGEINSRYRFIRSNILDLSTPNDLFFIEDYAYSISPKKSSLATLGELGGVIKYSLEEFTGLWPIAIASVSIKKWLSCGNLKQEDFKLAAFKKYGVECKTKDDVVAHTLADLAYSLLFGKSLFCPKFGAADSKYISKLQKDKSAQLKLIAKNYCTDFAFLQT